MCIRALDSCFSFFSFYISFLLQEMPDYILLITTVVPCCWRRWWHPTPVLLPGKTHGQRILVGCSPWGRKESDTTERLHFHFSLHALEKEMATHSNVLAWKIPGTGEPGGLPSMGSHRVRHDWSDLAAAAALSQYLKSSPHLEPTQVKFQAFIKGKKPSESVCCHSLPPWLA